jgi:hypothetical protein
MSLFRPLYSHRRPHSQQRNSCKKPWLLSLAKRNYGLHRCLRSLQSERKARVPRSTARLRYQSRQWPTSEPGHCPPWGDRQGWSRDHAVVAVRGSDIPDRAPLLRSQIRLTRRSNSSTTALLWAECPKLCPCRNLKVHVCRWQAHTLLKLCIMDGVE